MKTQIKEDCFAYNKEKNRCNALIDLFCRNEKCRFYKKKNKMSEKYIESAIKNYSLKKN